MIELFDVLSVIGVPIEEEEEDKVVTSLASLPNSFIMLVTSVLEEYAEVPSLEVITERLIHEDRKANEQETASSENFSLGRNRRTRDRSVMAV